MTTNVSQKSVHFGLGTVKHQKVELLDKIVIRFSDYSQVRGFDFTYEISAENLPTPINGKMNVQFNNLENQIANSNESR